MHLTPFEKGNAGKRGGDIDRTPLGKENTRKRLGGHKPKPLYKP